MRRLRRTYTWLLILPALAQPCLALNWGVEVVFGGGFPGSDASVILAGGVPSVVYSADGMVYSASKGAEGWVSEPVATCGLFGGWCDAAVSPAGSPAIAYVDASGAANAVRFAHRDSGSWIVEYVAPGAWSPDYVGLAYDTSGTAMIAFCDAPSPGGTVTLKLARRNGPNSWTVEDIATTGEITGPSLACDPSSVACVSYVDEATGAVRFARRIGQGNWLGETVDGNLAARAQWYTSLRFRQGDPSPWISYFVDGGDGTVRLKLARKPQIGMWSKEPVAAMSPSGPLFCSLALDAGGTPCVAFYDSNAENLAFAKKTSGGWFAEPVDTSAFSGIHPSVVLDTDGRPFVAFVDFFGGAVKFATSRPGELIDAKYAEDGRLLDIEGVVASTNGTELGAEFYVQTSDRAAGLQVHTGSGQTGLDRGDIVRVQGVAGTRSGERCIMHPTVTVLGSAPAPAPLATRASSVGGGDFDYEPGPPSSGQRGVVNGDGLNNIGLLMTVWGKVSGSGTDSFRLDDGSGPFGSAVELKVLASGLELPPEGTFAVVTGISSVEERDGGLHRMLRVRDQADIVVP